MISGTMSCTVFIPRGMEYVNSPKFKAEMDKADAMVMEAKENLEQ